VARNFRFTRDKALEVAALAVTDLKALREYLVAFIADNPQNVVKNNTWEREFQFVVDWLDRDMINPRYTILTEGNKKLSFFCFSVLPIVTCEGMGECGSYCYSLKSWRNARPFSRQLQNTILLLHRPEIVSMAFQALPQGVDFRLYVDGDFDSMESLNFWMKQLETRPDIRAYGYSKSWELFLNYGKEFPSNYQLNVSAGSRYSEEMKQKVLALDVARGEFISIKAFGKFGVTGSTDDNWTEYSRELRTLAKEQGHKKVFVCPSKCDTCTGGGHVCGLAAAKNTTVVIGLH
jgi:hypothetical protein